MSKVIYDGGDKIKIQETGLPNNNSFTDVNANDLRDAINDNDDRIINLETGNAPIVNVNAIWTGTGFVFDCFGSNIPVNGVYYDATRSNVTLPTADATLDRIDLIVFLKPTLPSVLGTFTYIQGTPATTALVVPPDYDASIYYPVKYVTIKAATTIPDGAEIINIFKENAGEPTEFTTTLTANLSISTNDKHAGTYSIEGTNTVYTDKSTFTYSTDKQTNDLSNLTFWIKLKAPMLYRKLSIRS